MPEQLIFDLPVREALGRDAFFVSPSNAMALATLDQCDLWPSSKLAVIGPRGSGKTHLAHVWAADRSAVILDVADIASADIPKLSAQRHVVVEGPDKIKDMPDAASVETALFHLHNLVLAEGGKLLFTAQSAPTQWQIGLPDLASRMQGTSVAKIDAPDDTLLAAMLLKQFDDRQIAISLPLIPYLVKRMVRSTNAVRVLVEALDREALRQGKPISRSLAGQVLDNLAQSEQNVGT